MAEFPRRLRAAASLLAALLAACGPAPSAPPAPAPVEALSEAEVETLARLLRAEDARDFSTPLLREAAASPTATVRRQGALALGRLRRPEGISLLIGLLNDADSSVAATAAFSLGQIGDSAAVPALAPLLSADAAAERPTVASEAAYALGKTGSARAHSVLLDLLSREEEVPVAPLGSALLAVWHFPRGPDLAPTLRWTGAADPELRWRAAYALTRRPSPAATPALRRLASDPDPRVRALSLRGLTAAMADSSRVDAGEALSTLIAALEDGSYPVRINAIRALGTYPDPRAVRVLTTQLEGADPHAAMAAAEGLARIGPAAAEAVPALRALALSDSVPISLRREALLALARVTPGEVGPLAARLAGAAEWRLRAAAARSLATLGVEAGADLPRLLRDRDGRVAAAALQALLDAAGESVAPLRPRLLEGLGSPDVGVRTAALGGLARLGDPSLLPVLLDAYQQAAADSTDDAALAAIDALAAARAPGFAPQRAFFARFPRSHDPLVRLRARERFGASADSAWGEPLPLDPGRGLEEYRTLVRRWLDPAAAGGADPEVEIVTAGGVLRLRLFAAEAPLTTANFLALAERGYFDGQEWPRVVPNFVVQGGDPRGDTSGGPGYAIRDEINRHRYGTGSLGMALSGPDTGGSQFFVTHAPQPHLDGGYTIFGEVLEGQALTERLLPGDPILTIRIVK